jgi:hypothetical protein
VASEIVNHRRGGAVYELTALLQLTVSASYVKLLTEFNRVIVDLVCLLIIVAKLMLTSDEPST